MSNSNNKTDVRITSVNRRAGDEWNYKDQQMMVFTSYQEHHLHQKVPIMDL